MHLALFSHFSLFLFAFFVQLQRTADLNDRVESLSSMKGCHFCFLGEGGEVPETAASLAAAAAMHPTQSIHGHGQTQVTVIPTPSSRSSAVVKAFIQIFLKKGSEIRNKAYPSKTPKWIIFSRILPTLCSCSSSPSFKYLSNCESGYAGCHALILASDHQLELIDHRQEDCLECTGRRKIKEKKQSFMRRFVGNVISKLDGEGEPMESIEEFQSTHLPETALVLLPSHSQAANASSPLSASSSASGVTGANSMALKLLHTVIRDKVSDLSSFADALHRITSILVATFLERVEFRERNVSTGSTYYTGLETTPVCTITTNNIGPNK